MAIWHASAHDDDRQSGVVDAPGYHGEGDALITRRDDVPLLVYGAECPGLAIVAPDCRGLAHCGWRGCAAGLPGKLIASMRACSAAPIERWQAFIGPGICVDCYEVDQPVIGGGVWPAGSLRAGRDLSHAQLDLQACILSALEDAGLKQIALAAVCTAMDERLWSFRHQGRGMVQALMLY
jgi:copper oxidase (laccase) domain-containing protein